MAAPVETHSGSATIGATEYSLPGVGTTLQTLAAAGVYTLLLDLAALTGTEQYELRLYERVRSGGTKRLVDSVLISGAQAEPVYLYAPQLPLMYGWDMTLRKVAGVDRAIEWSIRNTVDSALDAAVSSRAAPGAAMTLTGAERTAIAAVVEAALLNDGDGQALINAIVAAIGNQNIDQVALIAAIRADMERAGGMLAGTPAAVWANSVRTLTTSSAPTAAQVATAVRAELAAELGRVDVAISTRASEAAAQGRADQDVGEHNATQAALVGVANAIAGLGTAADPLAADPRTYPANSTGAAIARLLQPAGTAPLDPVPAAPADSSKCRVYGYFETLGGKPAAGVQITFSRARTGLTASQRLVALTGITVQTDKTGSITSGPGKPWLELLRTDQLDPPGQRYIVTCKVLGIEGVEIELTTPTADLRALLLAAAGS